MKLEVLQEDFSKALNIASRFASIKAQLPVLANLHLIAKGNKLTINATNLEISISISLGAKIKEEGEITIPARVITEIITNLPKKQINLEVDKEILTITTENFNSNVSGMNSSDFPKVPMLVSSKPIDLPKNEFLEALSKILFSVSLDESRPSLCGVLFIFEKNLLTLVSTDGFRLSKKTFPVKEVPKDFRIIIPRAILNEITRLSEGSEKIHLDFKEDEKQVVFSLTGKILSSRIIAGEFPPFEKIIPTKSDFTVEVDREDFLRNIKLSSVFAKDSASVIKLNFNDTNVEISAESKQIGGQKSLLESVTKGELPAEGIAFNYKFIEDVLSVIESDTVEMNFSGTSAPGVFKDLEDKNYLHLIMPVKIQV